LRSNHSLWYMMSVPKRSPQNNLMKTLCAVVIALSAWNADAQIRWQKLAVVEESDPATPALKQWKQTLAAKYKKGGIIVPDFSSSYELPSQSLKTLFPDKRFFAMSWCERPAEGKEKEAIGLAFCLGTTLVCDAEEKVIKEVFHTGNYEAFGELLSAEKVTIRNNRDAKIVWEAFCDLHQKHWKDQGIERKKDGVWHLGVTTTDDFHYYYQVKLDKQGAVMAGKLHADKIDGKGEQDGANQPATAVESKLEGKEKPKSEVEGRSQ